MSSPVHLSSQLLLPPPWAEGGGVVGRTHIKLPQKGSDAVAPYQALPVKGPITHNLTPAYDVIEPDVSRKEASCTEFTILILIFTVF